MNIIDENLEDYFEDVEEKECWSKEEEFLEKLIFVENLLELKVEIDELFIFVYLVKEVEKREVEIKLVCFKEVID